MSERITLQAHAKINLVLRVLDRAPTGYHQIETVFQRLELSDDVTVGVRDGFESFAVDWDLGVRPGDVGPVDRNLAKRAADAFARATGWPRMCDITILKRIPIGAGLGGGSSNAAAVLRALNSLSPSPVSTHRLCEIGATLGADVAFFVLDESIALGRGFGERLTPMEPLPTAHVALHVPAYGIGTASAYAALDRHREHHAISWRTAIAEGALRTWDDVASIQENDFEPPTFEEHPDLEAARAAFSDRGAPIARLSGSGSVVFGLWPDLNIPNVRPISADSTMLVTQTA